MKNTNPKTRDKSERNDSTNSTTRREVVIGGVTTALAAGVAAVGIARPNQASAQQPQETDPERTATGKLEGKVAVITGAALGIGRACTLALAREGADILAIDLCRDISTVPYPLATPQDLATVEQLVNKLHNTVRACDRHSNRLSYVESGNLASSQPITEKVNQRYILLLL